MSFLKNKITEALVYFRKTFKNFRADNESAEKARKALKQIEELGA